MFGININHVIGECSQLEGQHNEYIQYISELESAIRVLDSMASTQEMASRLRVQKKNMEEQREMLRQMEQALDQSVICYRNCERRICDDGEQAVIRFPAKEARVTDLGGLHGMLNAMLYE